MGQRRLAGWANRCKRALVLGGYALYSVYACMLFHSPTALSPVASLGSDLTLWFSLSLLAGRVLVWVACSFVPWHRVSLRLLRGCLGGAACVATCGFAVVGAALASSGGAGAPGVTAQLCAGAAVVGAADAAAVLALLASLIRLDARGVYRHLVASNLVAVALYYALTFVPHAAYPVAVACLLLALAAAFFGAAPEEGGTDRACVPATAAAVASPLWRPTVGVVALAFMAGLMLQISQRDGVSLESFQRSSTVASLILYAVLLVPLAVSRRVDLVKVYQVTIPLSTVGFLLLPLIGNQVGGIVNSFANLGFMLALLVLTCLSVEAARTASLAPHAVLAPVYAVTYAGELAGMLLGRWVAPLFGQNALAVTAVALAAAYVLLIVVLALFKDRSFREKGAATGESGAAGERAAAGTPATLPDRHAAAIAALAEAHGLTDRERAVLGQLGQGNTVHAVASRLYVSESTVKYHVRCVYRKLGIHTRQELVDEIARTERGL